MHVIEAEEVEKLDFKGLSCRLAHRSIGSCQVARRLADHVILSLGLLSGHGNAMSVNPRGSTRSPRPRSPERRDPFATQPIIEFARFALQTTAETAGPTDLRPRSPNCSQPEPLVGSSPRP